MGVAAAACLAAGTRADPLVAKQTAREIEISLADAVQRVDSQQASWWPRHGFVPARLVALPEHLEEIADKQQAPRPLLPDTDDSAE